MSTDGLHIQMFSIHGLLRAENMELGRDADTGGQIKYVVELCKALSRDKKVRKVDLFTRLVSDKSVSEDYARAVETVNDVFHINRIQCGGRKYMRKELLWPHLDEFVDKTIKFIKRSDAIPDVFHGHYADAGYVSAQLAEIFGVPFIYTGHSLGRSKLSRLLDEGVQEKDIIKKYRIDHRIRIEEEVLKQADLVVASTHQEVDVQYGVYENRDLPRFSVIPPGIDIHKFYPFYHRLDLESQIEEIDRYAHATLLEELTRFFMQPERPLILSLCRPDMRKNISGLIKAYGEDLELQSMANLAIFAGIRKDIAEMEENERDVLTEILLLMDKYDLYGKIAIPKQHDFETEVPELYRIAAEKRGVFVNSALTEPFGLTLIESGASGLPVVAPDDGGPRDIVANCQCGLLVDTTQPAKIAEAIKKIIIDNDLWKEFSKSGIMNIREHYTWESHADTYCREVVKVLDKAEATDMNVAVPADAIGRRLARLNYFIITDVDNTLIGEDNSELANLLKLLKENRGRIGFGIATGRNVESAVAHLKKHGVHTPDLIISSVGSEIYYGPRLQYGQGWAAHIADKWNRSKIKRLLGKFDFLQYQEEAAQRKFKVSYDMKPAKDRLAMVHDRLLRNKCRYNLIYSHDRHLDILPYRASKGKAIRYLSYKWEIPLKNFLVCGDSGNDEEMLRGEPLGVVVGNYSHELDAIKKSRNIYFARRSCAAGILEGIERYRFIEKTKPQGNR